MCKLSNLLLVAAVAAVTAGAEHWVRQHRAFNVVDFGADTTGTRDSTEAFNAAVIAACDKGGGAVIVPPGHYKVVPAKTWDMTQHGVTLHCHGYAKR